MEVTNRFKGLDLIDRVPEELWMQIRDIVQQTGIKAIPEKKKCEKATWLSKEALQTAVKREGKRQGEKESEKGKQPPLFEYLFLHFYLLSV